MLRWTLDRFFEYMTKGTEYGYEIWHLECKTFVILGRERDYGVVWAVLVWLKIVTS
jgi:hypothetical protein